MSPDPTVSLVSPFRVGRGFQRDFQVASPAAGAGFTVPVGGGSAVRLLALTFRFVTSAVVANRFVRVFLRDGDGVDLFATASTVAHTATNTETYSAARSLGYKGDGLVGAIAIGFLDLYCYPGWSLVVDALSIDGADQFSRIRVIWEEFSLGPDGYRHDGMVETEASAYLESIG